MTGFGEALLGCGLLAVIERDALRVCGRLVIQLPVLKHRYKTV